MSLRLRALVCIAHKPYRSVCAAGGAALGLLMLGKKLLPNKPVALFVVIGGIAAGVTGQRLILRQGDDRVVIDTVVSKYADHVRSIARARFLNRRLGSSCLEPP